MSSSENPNSNQNLPYPTSSNQDSNPKAVPATIPKVLTFDEVSNFFSSPLSDAADSLGVCTSVVKKICHENGLERWPYRQVRAGKSIEEIKREAAREKGKQVKDLSSGAQQLKNASSYFTTSHVEDKSASSMQSSQKPQSVTHRQVSKNPPYTVNNTQKLQISNFPGRTSIGLDEFKYGFPSHGLATVSYKWWGSSDSNDTKSFNNDGREEIPGKSLVDSNEGSLMVGIGNGNKTTENNDLDHLGEEGSLSALRKRGVKDGEEALKLGVHRKYNVNKMNPKKKDVLVQIFKSSLPSQWIDE